MNTELKDFAKKKFPDSKSDLFAMFIERGFKWCKDSGFNSMVTMQSWMFLSSYEAMREKLLQDRTIQTMAHLGARAFPEISGEVVQATAFVMQGTHLNGFKPVFFRLVDTAQDSKEVELKAGLNRFDSTIQDDFKKIPGSPIAYWVSEKIFDTAHKLKKLGSIGDARMGLATGNNAQYLRLWSEVSNYHIGFNFTNRKDAKDSNLKWFPYSKGGEYRKWFGNNEYILNWYNDGYELQNKLHPSGSRTWAHNFNLDYIFKDSLTWSDITSGHLSVRYNDSGFLFDGSGTSAFFTSADHKIKALGFLNTKFANSFSKILNPTLHFQTGDFRNMPFDPDLISNYSIDVINSLINIAKVDWDAYETSWDFTQNPIISTKQPSLGQAFNTWQQKNTDAVAEMKRLEEENNKLFIDAYGLQDELTPDVPNEQITLTRADREKDSQRLVSYALGCMMGRYSLDEPGLIYAHAGNQDFDASRYQTFPADADGIIPLTEMHWFEDDATHRIREFLTAVWDKDTLDANMQWLAESLDKKANETPEDTIRRYLASKFYKDHMQTYKKRPIYWLFSSGKQGAFQALVYLHRYNESTLARMRTEYVMPLISKMSAMANSLESEIENSDSAAEIKRKEKELQNLHKQQAELSSFEEKLRHYADQRITLDLDDGVKVNYGKFGDLLADVKAVTGEK